MNIFKVFNLFAIFATVNLIANSCTDAEIVKHSIALVNEHFGLRLLEKLESKTNGNVFISPTGVGTVLAMAMRGAGERTYEQMFKTLGFQSYHSIGDILNYYRTFQMSLNSNPTKSPNSSGQILRVANALAIQNNFDIKQSYLDDMRTSFAAQVFSVDFFKKPTQAADQINQWANKQTDGRISQIVDGTDPFLGNTAAILLNAAYFAGKWVVPFEPKTIERLFYLNGIQQPKSVQFMRTFGNFRLATFDDGQLLELPYKKEEIFSMGMFIFFPNKMHPHQNTTLSSRMLQHTLSERTSRLRRARLEVRLPKFQFKASYSLVGVLHELGIVDAFHKGRANFSNIYLNSNNSDKLYISDVFQKAEIEVDQSGTKASAVAASVIGILSRPSVVELNRPFIFFIRNNDDNVVLFSGVVNDPELNAD